LSVWGTNGNLGMYLRADFLKLFLNIEKMISFVGINIFSIGAREQKLCPNKFKTREKRQQKKIAKIWIFSFEFFLL